MYMSNETSGKRKQNGCEQRSPRTCSLSAPQASAHSGYVECDSARTAQARRERNGWMDGWRMLTLAESRRAQHSHGRRLTRQNDVGSKTATGDRRNLPLAYRMAPNGLAGILPHTRKDFHSPHGIFTPLLFDKTSHLCTPELDVSVSGTIHG